MIKKENLLKLLLFILIPSSLFSIVFRNNTNKDEKFVFFNSKDKRLAIIIIPPKSKANIDFNENPSVSTATSIRRICESSHEDFKISNNKLVTIGKDATSNSKLKTRTALECIRKIFSY